MTRWNNHWRREVAGLLAHGRDFSSPALAEEERRQTWGTRDAEVNATLSGLSGPTDATLEETKSRLVRANLEGRARRTEQEGLSAALVSIEAADWLGVTVADLRKLLRDGAVIAFIYNGELCYPSWQFPEDPELRVLPEVGRLVAAFDERHPSWISRFMTGAEVGVPGLAGVMTPVDWLAAGGDVQVIIDKLEDYQRAF